MENVITDFRSCKDHRNTCVSATKGWQTISYESKEGIRGVMLYSPSKTSAPILSIDLHQTGTHRLVVGLYNHDQKTACIRLKLCGDSVYRKMCVGAYPNTADRMIEECEWKTADLTGKRLWIAKAGEDRANIAYIKMIQVIEDAQADKNEPLHPSDRAQVGAIFDVGSLFCGVQGRFSRQSIHEMIEPFIDSDFTFIGWGTTYGTQTHLYHSKIGQVYGQGIDAFYSESMKKPAECMKMSKQEGWDPFAEAIRYAHANGLRIFADYRIEHTYDEHAFSGNFTSEFQRRHRSMRVLSRDQKHSPRLSLAYKQIRDYKVALLKEMALYDVDGIYVDFTRFSPVVDYEPPIVESFTEKFGKDPFSLHPHDKTWISHRAAFVTLFMRALRSAIDEAEKMLGHSIEIAAQVDYGYAHTEDPHCHPIDRNLVLGYDIKTWAQEGLVDMVAISVNARMHTHYNLRMYQQMVHGTDCTLWPVIGQHDNSLFPSDYDWQAFYAGDPNVPLRQLYQMNVQRLERLAADCYAQGADGLVVWEAGEAYAQPNRWKSLAKFGHKRELLKKWGVSASAFEQPPVVGASDVHTADDYK